MRVDALLDLTWLDSLLLTFHRSRRRPGNHVPLDEQKQNERRNHSRCQIEERLPGLYRCGTAVGRRTSKTGSKSNGLGGVFPRMRGKQHLVACLPIASGGYEQTGKVGFGAVSAPRAPY